MQIEPDWVIVGYGENEHLFAFGPFKSLAEAEDYADEFGGAWNRWNILPLKDADY